MDLADALRILEIESGIGNVTLEYVKKKYHKLALRKHPDKNGNTIQSKETFQQLNEAYHLVVREISIINSSSSTSTTEEKDKDENNSPGPEYTDILRIFIHEIVKGNYNSYISTIIQDIVSGCKDISLTLFQHMNKEQSLSIYQFIIKYKYILHLEDETIEKVKLILLEKFKDMQIYCLNPSLRDLFQNNVYKLDIEGKIYFVPLWHSELYFDTDIVVKCNPELPPNTTIDEDNNLIIQERVSFTFSLLQQKVYSVKVGETYYHIPIDKLYIRPFQTYVFKQQGISKIVEQDIYNVEEKGDIIIHIIFE
jgi:hypothetical protein